MREHEFLLTAILQNTYTFGVTECDNDFDVSQK